MTQATDAPAKTRAQISERTLRQGGRMDPGGTSSTGGAMDEIATFHAASLLQRFRGSSS